jgi:hypothetical protein
MACSFFDTNSSQKPNKKEQVRHANAKTSDKSSYKRSEDRNEEPACRGVGYKWFRRQAAKTYLQTNRKTGCKGQASKRTKRTCLEDHFPKNLTDMLRMAYCKRT